MQPDDWRTMTRVFLCLVFMWLLPLEANGSTASALNHPPTTVSAPGSPRPTRPQQASQQGAGSDVTPSTPANVTPGAAAAQTVATSAAASPTFPSTAARHPTAPPSGPPELSSDGPTQTSNRLLVQRDHMTSSPLTLPAASIMPGDQSSRSLATGAPPATTGATTGAPPAIMGATTGAPPAIMGATTGAPPATTGAPPASTGAPPAIMGPTTGAPPAIMGARSSTTALKATARSTAAQSQNSRTGGSHSSLVAGLIGGALVLMMLGFLAIYFQKRKVQKQQITTSEWAGPSPFLSDGDNNRNVTFRSSSRISLSSFLPQRLSKRLSLLPETDEELQDMTPGTTFETKHQGKTFGDGVGGKDARDQSGPNKNGFSETSTVLQTSPPEAADPQPDESASEAPTA